MLILGEPSSNTPTTISVGKFVITATNTVELLGISIDSKLTFSSHILSLCKKASNRIRNLNRIRCYLNQKQLFLLCNSFIISIFNYAPIVWMFCNKSLCSKIDTLHKRALRSVYGDFSSTYEALLQKSGSNRIHELHLRHLLCEVYKTVHCLNPSFMQDFFIIKSTNYSFRNQNLLSLPPAKTNRFGTQSFSFRGSLLWNKLPDRAKSQPTITAFKKSIKTLSLINICSCKLCMVK